MISATTGGSSKNVLQDARHVLFVEGEDSESFDAKVIENLFDNRITVRVLGPSYSVKNVATALHRHHPDYYFLVDRDPHHSDEEVENSWSNFPDPLSQNLLIWRRREIENYFLDPAYLKCSKFCRVSECWLTEKLLKLANQRLYLDAANHVIVAIRERQKRDWIKLFSDPQVFSSAESALNALKNCAEFPQRHTDVGTSVSLAEIERIFNEILHRMTGGQKELVLGREKWLDMVQGKAVLSQMVNSAAFEVKTNAGKPLQGREKTREIAKDLLQQGAQIEQPKDFQELKALVLQRIRAA